MSKQGKQLELPLPRLGAAERKAFIRHRLQGLEYRQTAREARRQVSYERRRAREAGELQESPAPEQLQFTGIHESKHVTVAKQLPLPIAPFWTL